MAKRFSDESWARIFNALTNKGEAAYGIPGRDADSFVLGSWNIRKFGALKGEGGNLRSDGAWALVEKFASACDLLAIQEVQSDLASVEELVRRLNKNDADPYHFIASDVAGKSPGEEGMGERFAVIFRADIFKPGPIISDITFDQSAVVERVNVALAAVRKNIRGEDKSKLNKAYDWFSEFTGFDKSKLPTMFDFVRSPHCINFSVQGRDGSSQEFACVNAYLVSGSNRDREREFFALLEWLRNAISGNNFYNATAAILMADLNLDFQKDNDVRRLVIEEFVTNLNEKGEGCAINFPFLDRHLENGVFRTNSRESETYDHIAFFSKDPRFPRGRHNGEAGRNNPDRYDYGMFDFLRLFRDAGAISGEIGADYLKFEFDVSDHMPIWVRLPIPQKGQREYHTD
ncbi:MAG: hypothetical protein IPL47_12685 [Phyllobacteriaceae bacterium]|nr:hypothetical protein [Phyllobacteriaceae bacterium]